MLNKAILMGRLVRDPEMRKTQNGASVASFTLAVERQKDKNGNKQTDFIDCVAWSHTAEFLCQWFTKGMMAVVVGQIQSRNWEDKNGNKRTSVEVNCEDVSFGETKKSREQNGYGQGGYGQSSYQAPAASQNFEELPDDEGDVPF